MDNSSPIKYPDPPVEQSEKFSFSHTIRILKSFGPAAFVASVSIGAGESVLAVRAGAWAGYSLLWVILLAAVLKAGLITYLIGRYTVLSGELISARFAKVPGPKYWSVLAVVIIALFNAPFFVAAIAVACGGLLNYLTSLGTPVIWGIFFILISTTFGTLVSFKNIENHLVFVCWFLVVVTISGAILAQPSVMEIVKGLFLWGVIPEPPQWALNDPEFSVRPRLLEIATTFGYIGGSCASYAVYANFTSMHGWGLSGSPMVKEIRQRAWNSSRPDYLPAEPEEIKKGMLHIKAMKYDVLMGMGVLLFVSLSFMIAGAAIMNPNQLLPSGYVLLSKQKVIWEQVNPILVPMYYISILTALWGVLYSIPGIYGRLSHEFFGVVFRRVADMPYKRFSMYIGAFLVIGASFLLLSGIKPIRLMDVAAMLSTNVGISLLSILALWANLKLPKPYRPHPITVFFAGIAIIVLSYSSYLSITNF